MVFERFSFESTGVILLGCIRVATIDHLAWLQNVGWKVKAQKAHKLGGLLHLPVIPDSRHRAKREAQVAPRDEARWLFDLQEKSHLQNIQFVRYRFTLWDEDKVPVPERTSKSTIQSNVLHSVTPHLLEIPQFWSNRVPSKIETEHPPSVTNLRPSRINNWKHVEKCLL